MKRALITVWNVCLLLFVLFWTCAIIPKVMLQFSGLHLFSPGTSRARAIMFGLEGIGLLMTIAATSASFCSLFWREVAKPWRLAFAVIFAVLAAGTFIAEWINYLDDRKYLPPTSGVSLDGDHVAFVLTISLFLLPLVVFGRSYPNLAMIACSRIFSRRNLVTNDAGSDSSKAVHESDSAKGKSMTN